MKFTHHIQWLTLLTLLVNAAAMLSPVINGGDSITYAALSQHIAVSGDWSDLMLDGQDWLDKPHLPFWITAVSFKLFGVSVASYILPGFLAHLLGGFFTYRLARLFYGRDAAWLSVLVYVSAYQLMDAAIEVKAETYLTAFIMGACYYGLRFDAQARLKYLLLGALFSAMAVMTKGIFTLITINSGLVCMWLFRRRWEKLWGLKWWLMLALSLALTAPELVALYTQFDAHPEKIVFGHTQVSGIKFFLWDSQFGRFFNTGPIENHNGFPLYFVLVFFWAFLPWVAVFCAAIFSAGHRFSTQGEAEKSSLIFFCGAFFITFALFSATSFQLDHYTVILFPFAAILCGKFLSDWLADAAVGHALYRVQMGIALMLAGLAGALVIFVGSTPLWLFLAIALLVAAALGRVARAPRRRAAIVYPLLAMNVLYGCLALMTALTFGRIDMAHRAAELIRPQAGTALYAHQMALECRELALYLQTTCTPIADLGQLAWGSGNFTVIVRDADVAQVQQVFPQAQRLAALDVAIHKTGTFKQLVEMAQGAYPLEKVSILHISRP